MVSDPLAPLYLHASLSMKLPFRLRQPRLIKGVMDLQHMEKNSQKDQESASERQILWTQTSKVVEKGPVISYAFTVRRSD